MSAIKSDTNYFYFSFGSNMLKERIRLNDPTAMPYAAAKLDVSFTSALHYTFYNLPLSLFTFRATDWNSITRAFAGREL